MAMRLAMRTAKSIDKEEGGGEGRDGGRVPGGEERQQVCPHQLYRNLLEATLTSPYGVEARSRFNPADDDEEAPIEPVPPPLPWPMLHECEVMSAIMHTRPFAACGPDDIPNHVLQLLLPHLLPHLVPLYRASLALGHVP